MIIEVKNQDVYIPKFGKNLKLPEAEQIRVHHRYLLPGERKKYFYNKPIKVTTAGGSEMEIVQDLMGVVKAIVTKIENLQISCDGKPKKIDTAEKLYTCNVPQILVALIESHMMNVSPEVDVDFLAKP